MVQENKMSRKNPTHSSRLARQLSEISGLPYTRALRFCKEKAEQGDLTFSFPTAEEGLEKLVEEFKAFKAARQLQRLEHTLYITSDASYREAFNFLKKKAGDTALVIDVCEAVAPRDIYEILGTENQGPTKIEPFKNLTLEEKIEVLLEREEGYWRALMKETLSKIPNATCVTENAKGLSFVEVGERLLALNLHDVTKDRSQVERLDGGAKNSLVSFEGPSKDAMLIASSLGARMEAMRNIHSSEVQITANGEEGEDLKFKKPIKILLGRFGRELQSLLFKASLYQALKSGTSKNCIIVMDKEAYYYEFVNKLAILNANGPKMLYLTSSESVDKSQNSGFSERIVLTKGEREMMKPQ